MNLEDTRYSKYELCHEMMETVDIVSNFNQDVSKGFITALLNKKKIFLTGEGSSRIFPAKHFRDQSSILGTDLFITTTGAAQAQEYMLEDYVIWGSSNSGNTNEIVQLFLHLKDKKHHSFFGVTATPDSPVATIPNKSVLLTCGKENAVAATKSVIEQALFFESMLYNYLGIKMPNLHQLSENIKQTLGSIVDYKIINALSNAPVVYFSGRNNGVAEELTLKTNEIIRKKSVFLEGTYALHGIEEVMNKGEIMVVIEPFQQEEQNFQKFLVEEAGVTVIAISTRDTIFPTIKIPQAGAYENYIELAAGWNLLTETGIHMGINLDKPIRARKIGNESNLHN